MVKCQQIKGQVPSLLHPDMHISLCPFVLQWGATATRPRWFCSMTTACSELIVSIGARMHLVPPDGSKPSVAKPKPHLTIFDSNGCSRVKEPLEHRPARTRWNEAGAVTCYTPTMLLASCAPRERPEGGNIRPRVLKVLICIR